MKKANNIFKGFLAILSMVIVLSGCVKNDYDNPPVTSVPFDANKILTIEQVKQIYADSGQYKFKDVYSVYATVAMDDATGNIYKSAYVQDNSEGIDLYLNASGLYQGDSIRIMLKGASVSMYHELMQIQDLHVDSSIVKLKTQVNVEPELVTIADIYTGEYQSKLIKLEDVQFVQGDLGKTYADAVGLQSENRTLESCDGSTIIVRTSGYASFAGEKLPTGKGSIIAIASVYDDDMQLVIRRLSEVNLTGERCGGGGITPVDDIHEYFDNAVPYEDIYIQGWSNIVEVGDRKWQGKDYESEKYAQATGYNSDLPEMVTWLITPPIKMDQTKYLNFVSAKAFWAHTTNKPLTVLASTDFDGIDVSSATWIELNPTLANENSPDNAWIESGDVDLSAFNDNVYIAFKYIGSMTESTSFRLDNIVVSTSGGGGGSITPVDEIHEYFDEVVPYEDITIDGWYNIIVTGDRFWQGKEYDSEKYAQATGYNSGLPEMETWLITPPVTMGQTKYLNFVSAKAYWAHTSNTPLTVLASTDFDGSDVISATWIELTPTLANENSPDNEWIESGDVDLSGFTENVFIAFKYVGSDTESTSFRIDDVVVTTSGGGGGDGVTSINENFQSQVNYEDINIAGWLNINEIGSRKWQGKEYDSEIYAQATSYNSGEENVCWLITPKIALDEMTNPKFSFESAQAYWAHNGFSVLISTDFNGSDLTAATWTSLDCIIAGQNDPDHEWIPSGVIDLSSYSGYAYIAFKYEGSDPSETTSYRVDNVLLVDE